MSKIRVRLVKSVIGSTKRQKLTVQALGLGKIDSTCDHTATEQINGMIRKVNHLVSVEKLK